MLRWWHGRYLDRSVRKRGWTGVYVGDYDTAPTWTYTLGFEETLGQPELVIFDIPYESANAVLWTAYEELKRGDLVLEDGLRWHADDGERPMVWRKVHPTQVEGPIGWFMLAVMRRLVRKGEMFGLQAFQLVLSDDDGRMPWEADYNEGIRFRQPALYLPAADYGETPLSAHELEALRIADERGWSIMRIDAPSLKWAYTVGLADAGLPELIACLPSADGAANVLEEARVRIASDELKLTDGLRWNDLGFECCWRRVHQSQYLALNVFFLTKLRYEQRSGTREAAAAYQLFIPDDGGRYPWEDGCARGVRDAQPLLFEPHHSDQLKRGPLAALMRM